MDPQLFLVLLWVTFLILGLILVLIFTIYAKRKAAITHIPPSPSLFGQVYTKTLIPMVMTIALCANTLLKALLIYLGYLFAAILVSTDIKSHLKTWRSSFKQDK